MCRVAVFVFVLVVVAVSQARILELDRSLDQVWESFKQTHNKNYASDKEEFNRRRIFEENAEKVRLHNLEYDLGQHTFTMGVNEYSDLTFEEYQKYLLGAKIEYGGKSKIPRQVYVAPPYGDLPDSVDWRTKGYVTGVKNQGQCGSCWAFSSTGAIEGQHFKSKGELVSLSEQNFVDCVVFNAGCNGGWMDNAFSYVMRNEGVDTESSYPYETKDGPCRYDASHVGSTVSSLVDVPSYREDALKSAVAYNGPVSIAIDAAHPSFQQYKSGIYFESACSRNETDHAVLAVGYGKENGYDYWLVKNSWGDSWGDKGYIKMARNFNNMCAVATYASFPLL